MCLPCSAKTSVSNKKPLTSWGSPSVKLLATLTAKCKKLWASAKWTKPFWTSQSTCGSLCEEPSISCSSCSNSKMPPRFQISNLNWECRVWKSEPSSRSFRPFTSLKNVDWSFRSSKPKPSTFQTKFWRPPQKPLSMTPTWPSNRQRHSFNSSTGKLTSLKQDCKILKIARKSCPPSNYPKVRPQAKISGLDSDAACLLSSMWSSILPRKCKTSISL